MGFVSPLNRDMFAADLKLTLMKNSTNKIIISILASFLVIFNANAISDALKIKVINGTYTDETVIRFLPTATSGFDGSWDAYKIFSSSAVVPALFSKTGTNALSINALPSLTAQNDIALYTHIKVNGTYTFQAIELGTGFSPGIQIVLKDLVTGITYNFKGGNSISIPMTVNTVSSSNRFVIHISPPTEIYSTNPSCYGLNNGSIVVNKTGNSDWSYILTDNSGNMISSATHNSQFVHIAAIAAGTYTIITNSPTSLPDTATLAISEPLQIAANFSSIDSVKITDGAVNFINNSMNSSLYTWDFGDASPLIYVSEPSHQYNNNGIFTVSLTASDSSGCSSTYSKNITVYPGLTYQSNQITVTEPTCHGSNNGTINIFKAGNYNYYYQLSDSAGTIVSNSYNNSETIVISELPAGDYTLITSSATSFSDTTSITVSQPLQVIAQFSSVDSVLTGEEIQFVNNSMNGVSYTWDFGDASGTISATEISHQYNTSGIFTVSLTASDSAGCSSNFSQVITVYQDMTTGITAQETGHEIIAYQREGGIQVNINSDAISTMQVAIYNNNGQKLYQSNQEKTSSLSEMIPLSTSGTYIVHALINSKLYSKRVAIVK
ncbi:MAG: Serine protease, subtilase family [Bacteroidetes bacterium]|jgi:PKD repeat protein|nr:Serine protease, subtilase family [Bacteroidota bacterium]